MYEVTLRKVKGGSAIRTDETVGRCHRLPAIGESFEMFSEPLDKNACVRWLTTSTVQNITSEDSDMLIETRNSTYRLEFK